jgi:ribosomal protein S18 acetylase RimI-like enzyme
MISREYNLRPATFKDLQIVLSWVTTPESLLLWGGPALTFPTQVNRTWLEMGANDQNVFSLIDQQENVVGFGQTLFHEPDIVHLGRIIISPASRGKGIGRILCQKLIRVGVDRHKPSQITLNVYKNNTTAINLYTSLGFTVLSEDFDRGSYKMCLRLD